MKQTSAAADRNKGPIFEVLNPLLPPHAKVLEIASGTGQHGHYVCQQRPDIVWQPTDLDPEALASIRSWQSEAHLPNFREPIAFDVLNPKPASIEGPFDAIVSINMIHIAPWEASLHLLDHAKQLLQASGLLYFYGPFIIAGRETAASNLAFDLSLREQNSQWGLRELDQVVKQASLRGFAFQRTVDMPANNVSVILRKVSE